MNNLQLKMPLRRNRLTLGIRCKEIKGVHFGQKRQDDIEPMNLYSLKCPSSGIGSLSELGVKKGKGDESCRFVRNEKEQFDPIYERNK